MWSAQQQGQLAGSSWLRRGIAGPCNLAILLTAFLLFPFVAKWTHAFAFASTSVGTPQHTGAFLRFCLVLLLFEWAWFLIALVGIRRFGKVSFTQLIGGQWNRATAILTDMGIAFATLALLLVVGTLLQQFLSRFEHDSAALRSMFPQNALEATGFLAAALTAGFVEEFVFRGYLQTQLTAMSGSAAIGSTLQILLFIQGHYYQGMLRLIPVGVFGLLFTLLALWRKSLRPGIIAHSLGDGSGAIMFFVRLL